MKKSLLGLMLASTMTLGSTAFADDMYHGAWYLLPGVSYMHTDSDLEAKDGGGGFLKFGREISQHWDLQAGLNYNKADEDFSGNLVKGDYKQSTMSLDALYMFSRDKFRPFLLAGLGVARNNTNYELRATGADVGDEKTSWLGNVGVGVQYLFTDAFGIQADLRQQWSRAKVDHDLNGSINNETVSNTLFNLGGIFRFGAPKAAPVIAAAPVMVEDSTLPAIAPRDEYVPEPLNIVQACSPTMETITVDAEELFGFDRSKLTSTGQITLNDVAEELNANPEIALVMVIGHTDRIGSAAYNQRLSERRATMVANYLISRGVDSSRLQAIGRGETEPVVECTGVRGKALIKCLQPNRRVEIIAQMTKEIGCE